MTANAGPTSKLGFQLLLKEQFTDLKVTCNGATFNVHRSIVCARSEWFEKACTNGMKEAQECEIDFPGSDVDSMARLLIFLYTDEYDEDDFDQLHSDHKDILCRWQVSQVRNLKTEARMYAVGDLYLVEPLMKHATKSFKRRLGQSYRGSEDEAFWSEMKEAIGVIYGLPANDGRHRDIKNILIIQGWRKLKLCGTANIAKPYLLEIAENSPEFVVDALIMGLQLPWVAEQLKS